MFKRSINLFVLVFIFTMLFSVTGNANEVSILATGVCGKNASWVVTSDGVITISGTGKIDQIELGDYENSVKTVVIGEGITSIPDRAFNGNHIITNVKISSTVTDIGYRAFAACLKMESYTVAENNLYYSSDENGILYSKDKDEIIQFPTNSSLTSFSIPISVKKIGDSAFAAASLEILDFSPKLEIISESAFQYFSIKELALPLSLKRIEKFAFYGAEIEKIDFNVGLEYIGPRAFNYNDSIVSVYIPSSVTFIGNEAFSGCRKLREIIVDAANSIYCSDEFGVLYNKDKSLLMQYPNGRTIDTYKISENTKSIDAYAFWACRNLKNLIFSENTENIGREAFSYCSALTQIYFNKSLKEIGDYSFNNCANLNDIYFSGTKKQWEAISIGIYDDSLTNANYYYEMDYPISYTGKIESYLNNEILHIKSDFSLSNSLVLIVKYDSNNKMLAMEKLNITENKNYIQYTNAILKTNEYYKVLVWSGIEALKPLANATIINDDLRYETDEYEEIKLLYLVNTFDENGINEALYKGYYVSDTVEMYLNGTNIDKMAASIIGENDTITSYSDFVERLQIAVKRYYEKPMPSSPRRPGVG